MSLYSCGSSILASLLTTSAHICNGKCPCIPEVHRSSHLPLQACIPEVHRSSRLCWPLPHIFATVSVLVFLRFIDPHISHCRLAFLRFIDPRVSTGHFRIFLQR